MTSMEGQDPWLDGKYRNRKQPYQKCALAALNKGYRVFAIQNGGQCFISKDAGKTTYKKYGESKRCKKDGRGGPWSNNVYKIIL